MVRQKLRIDFDQNWVSAVFSSFEGFFGKFYDRNPLTSQNLLKPYIYIYILLKPFISKM